MTICPTDAVLDFYRIKLIGKHGSGSSGAVLQRNRIGTTALAWSQSSHVASRDHRAATSIDRSATSAKPKPKDGL